MEWVSTSRRTFLLGGAGVLISACTNSSRHASRSGSASTGAGPTGIRPQPTAVPRVAALTVTASDGRSVPLRVWGVPGAPARRLVVFSHGAGGDAPTYDFLGQQWATAGFVAVFPTHQDSLRAMVNAGQTVAQAVRQLQRMVADPSSWRHRIADVVAARDSATRGTLGGFAVDCAACAAAGHSLGAWTAMLATGVTPVVAGAPLVLADPAFTSVLLLSAQGVGQWGLTESSFAGLKVPTMAMSGTLDRSQTPGASQTYEQKLDVAELSPPGEKWAVVVVDATHFSFSGPGSGRLLGRTPQERADSAPAVYDTIQRLTSAFLELTLAGESGAPRGSPPSPPTRPCTAR